MYDADKPVSGSPAEAMFSGRTTKAAALLAKAPVAGAVKTRLTPALSAEESASLHAAFVADVWKRFQELEGVDCWLFSDRVHPWFEEIAAGRIRPQSEGDLGNRLLRCFEQLSAAGYDRIVIVGADSPTLPASYLRMSFQLLEQVDAVIGPSEDGGYYAVGCRKPHGEMFEGVEWSTERAFEQTEAAFDRAGLSMARLPVWYDVDRFEDLLRLVAEEDIPENTRRWLHDSALSEKLGREHV